MDNVTKLREAYRFWDETKGTNSEKWMNLMADDVVFRSLAGGETNLEFTGECSSKQQVERYFAGLGVDWEILDFTAEDFIAEGDRVAVRGHCAFKHRKTGKIFQTLKADFYTFRDGKIVEYIEFYDTMKAFAASRPE